MIIGNGDDLAAYIPTFSSGADNGRTSGNPIQVDGRADVLGDDAIDLALSEGR
jgi:hypothetical protein